MNSKLYSINKIPIYRDSISALRPRLENLLFSDKMSVQIITLNTDFLRIAYSDVEFYSVCRNSHLVVADGIGIVFFILLKYHKIIERITGSALFNSCFEIADCHSLRIALVGSSTTTLSKLSDRVNHKWPAVILKTISPNYGFEADHTVNNQIVNELKNFHPDILLVALGCPRQEKWIHVNKDFIGAKINIGVGAVFDFFSGTKKRAPIFIQRTGFEWIWRLLHEPRRLGKRYLFQDLPFFLKSVIRIIFRLED